MELGVKSKALKRRLRRQRMDLLKSGDILPFDVAKPVIEPGPKLTNTAKRVARKRRKLANEKECSDEYDYKPVFGEDGKLQYKPILKVKNVGKKTILSCDDEMLFGGELEGAHSDQPTVCQESVEEVDKSDGESSNGKNGSMKKAQQIQNKDKTALPPKKRRYVLFVGNLAYETKEEDVMEHFKKVGSIVSVRLAKHQDQKDKCRGFCHLEVKDEETYLKALSLNHTFMAKRRINVEYSSGQLEGKGDMRRKNFKLQTLSKRNQFGNSSGGRKKKSEKVETVPNFQSKGAFFV